MLIDARRVETNSRIFADIVIVGSGPAALTLAAQLSDGENHIVVLESGGLEDDPAVQSFSEGARTGHSYPPLESTRHRQVGGTSHRWDIGVGDDQLGVRYAPLDAVDFARRDWVAHSGWPITRAQLNPFYERAHKLCELGRFDYDGGNYAGFTAPLLSCGPEICTTMFQFGSRHHFTQTIPHDLAAGSTTTICYHADVTKVETDDTGRVATGVHVATRNGKHFEIIAKRIVLAAGGIENARLLLLSDRVHPAGLGNQHDVVGRYFMDHPLGPADRLIPANRELFNLTALYDLRRVDGIPVMGKLQLSEDTIVREKLLSMSAILFPRPVWFESDSVCAFKNIVRSVSTLRKPHKLRLKLKQTVTRFDQIIRAASDYARMLPAVPSLGRGGWSMLDGKEQRFASYEILYQVEQSPDPQNRVTLDTARDALGRRKVRLNWTFSDSDHQRQQRTEQILTRALADHHIGKLEQRQDGLYSASTHHHMGTTRMSDNPLSGVVDANCKVHGVENLFIAGSSVFTTGGYANPTLTIIALSIRLADHLKGAPTSQKLHSDPRKHVHVRDVALVP